MVSLNQIKTKLYTSLYQIHLKFVQYASMKAKTNTSLKSTQDAPWISIIELGAFWNN